MILRSLLPGQRVRAQLEYLMMNIMKAAFACICLSVTWPFKHSLSSHLSLSQAFRSSEQRKEMLAEKKTTTRGVGLGWERGNGCKTFEQKLVPVYQILVYAMIGLFRPLASTKRFIALNGNVTWCASNEITHLLIRLSWERCEVIRKKQYG